MVGGVIITSSCQLGFRFELDLKWGALSSLLNWRQEPQFNYYIRYGFQVWRAYRSGGASNQKVVRSTERSRQNQIWASDQFCSEAATERPLSLSPLYAAECASRTCSNWLHVKCFYQSIESTFTDMLQPAEPKVKDWCNSISEPVFGIHALHWWVLARHAFFSIIGWEATIVKISQCMMLL